jgi:antitoxin (DNA-binding transcriptional repressor) of toxin-antitoxin stability system
VVDLPCLTRDTLVGMGTVTIRDLRNHGGDVVARAARGEPITITRAGKPVAELRAVPQAALSAEVLIDRRRRLPELDPLALRHDVDQALDSTL